MNYEFPLVIFTVFSQFAVGLALFATWKSLRCTGDGSAGGCEDIPEWRRKDWVCVFLLVSAGLAASLFHLARPLRAAEALGNLPVSWLSREGLLFGLFAALALLNVFRENRTLAVLASLAGLAGIAAQGFTYAPASMPAVSNGVPMLLFLLSALAMGAAAGQVNGCHDFSTVFRAVAAALAAVLLIVPCLWTSGGAVMQATARLWMQSWMFWAGLGLIALSLVFPARLSRKAALAGLAAIFCGITLTRLVFFGGVAHTAANLGMPY